jgi:hypothetical protein
MSKGNFTDGMISAGDLVLRPFTLGTLDLCQEIGLTLFTGESADDISTSDKTRQAATYLWMQSEPIDSVLAAVEKGKVKETVRRWMFKIPPSVLEEATPKIMASIEAATAARVEVEEKPDHKPETAPPNS